MSLFYFNSTNRVYNDDELNKLSDLLFTNGVFNSSKGAHKTWETSGDFLVEAQGGNMTITAKAGVATAAITIDGVSQQAIINETSQLAASVAANVDVANRSDAVVLRIDQSVISGDTLNADGDNAVSLVVVSGSDSNPLTDIEISTAFGGDPFIRLANITVPLGTSEITNSMITDARTLPKMSRAMQMASDGFQFYPLSEDPADPQSVEVWYNSTEGILKMYDGEKVISLQAQTFDWGYYPPSGEFSPIKLTPTAENDSGSGSAVRAIYQFNGANDFTLMQAQLFKLPNIDQPYFRIKMGNPSNEDPNFPASIKIRVYTDNAGTPGTLVEDLGTINYQDVPVNEYIELFTSATYTPGTNYILVISSTRIGNDSAFYAAQVRTSSYTNDDVFLGLLTGEDANTSTSDPTTLSWSKDDNRQMVMEVIDSEEKVIGQNDTSGNVHELAQSFVSQASDIVGFKVIKGASVGSPTGFLKATLYKADSDKKPTGNQLTSATITQSEWEAVTDGENATFTLDYDELTVGTRYVVVIETENNSDINNYTLYFVNSNDGGAIRNTTAEGWVDAGGDIILSVVTSPINKIVVTDDQGNVPDDLVKRKNHRVLSYVSTATPEVNVDSYDAVVITALAEAITGVTVVGDPQDFRLLKFRITATVANQSITWGSQFVAKGVALPTSVTNGKTRTTWFEWDDVTEKWGCIKNIEN